MNPQKFPDLSIDIETLGLTSDAIIIQIGIVEFNTDTGEIGDGIEIYPDLKEQQSEGRSLNMSTLKWWVDRNPELLSRILNGEQKRSTVTRNILLQTMPQTRSYWFNHPLFDMGILSNAYRLNLEVGDNTLGHRAYRKVRDVYTLASALNIKPPEFVGVRHDALSDALNQAKWVIKCYKEIKSMS